MPYSIGSDNNSDNNNDFFMMILLLMNPARLCEWSMTDSIDLFLLKNVDSINTIRSVFFILEARSQPDSQMPKVIHGPFASLDFSHSV